MRCDVPTCKNLREYGKHGKYGSGPRTSFHICPKKTELRKLWLKFLKKTPESEGRIIVCSDHFDKSCYIYKMDLPGMEQPQRKVLTSGAVPSIYVPESAVSESKNPLDDDDDDSVDLKALVAAGESGGDTHMKVEMEHQMKSFDKLLERSTSVSCCVLSCWNFGPDSNRQDVSYHSFPDDPDLSKKWWLATGRKLTNDFDPSGYTICSLHFSKSDWISNGSETILKSSAIPHRKEPTKPTYSLAVCRLCLTELDVLGDLFLDDAVSQYLVKMLGRVLETEVADYVNWPRKICIDCFNNLHKFGKFCQKMKKSHLTIKQRFGNPEWKSVEFVAVNSGEFLLETSNDEREPVLKFREMFRIEQAVPKMEECVDDDTVAAMCSSYIVDAEPSKCVLKQKYHKLICGKCPQRTFPFFKNLQHHLKTCHPNTSDGSVECCGGSYQYLFQFVDHMRTHNEIQKAPEPAVQCDELVDRVEIHEVSDPSNQCEEVVMEMQIQEEIHNAPKSALQCEDLLNQMPIQVEIPKASHQVFQCEFCDAQLTSGRDLTSHIRFIHPEKRKEYRCSECKIAYYSKYHYDKHMLSHVPSSAGLQCKSCDSKFSTPHQLKLHTEIEHIYKPTQVCHICGLATQSINLHLKTHSNLNERRKRCLQCNRWVVKLGNHSCTLATINDPRECPVCQKTFRNNFSLKIHFYRTHKEGVKEHKCSICDRVFKRSERLKGHIASQHTKELQYKCDICDQKFITYGAFYSHRKLKHKEEHKQSLKKKFDVI